jgi:hypothetical protein
MPKRREIESGPYKIAEHFPARLHVLVTDPHNQIEIFGLEACSEVVSTAEYIFAAVEVVHEAGDRDSGFLG